MNKISLVLSGLLALAFVIMLAPNVLAMNKGKALRNMAVWLAIFLVLALIHINFDPTRKMGFAMPNLTMDGPTRSEQNGSTNGEQPGSDQGYMPPKDD